MSDLRTVRTLAVLGDSIGLGIGDPAIGGGWRGFAPLLAAALGNTDLVNLSHNGARVRGLRTGQLPAAITARPDAAVVIGGMNDTLRSDFDARAIAGDFDRVVGTLSGMGTIVVMVRYHDHGRVFRLPGPLHRALARRINALNAAVDEVALRYGVGVVDLDRLPGTYLPHAWSVDRLHPSEWGHRMLAGAIADRLAEAGAHVPGEVSARCGGSAYIRPLDRVLWMIVKGLPWVFRRGADLIPYLLQAAVEAALRPDEPITLDPVADIERAAIEPGVSQATP
ncbi:MAG TPA: SGNH/GDSL hydrolase family protein [Pseudonocardiaceae bacterium]|nr:SGNH/GDSL hydrolase family protein [Pseudonocardiaceae bacterium]